MSSYLVCIYVATATLAAAMITLCGVQLLTLSKNFRKRKPPPTLAESESKHRRLSSISSDGYSDRYVFVSSAQRAQRPAANRRKSNDSCQNEVPSALNAPFPPAIARDSKLNSVQSIQARSAALRSDSKPGKASRSKPLIPTYASPTQQQAPHARPAQDYAPALPNTAGDSVEQEKTKPTPPDVKQRGEPVGQVTSSQSTASKDTTGTKETPETRQTVGDQAAVDGLSDLQSLDLLEPSGFLSKGSQKTTSASRPDDVLDIFAGSSEEESELSETTDDLSEIDGGSLQSAAQRPPRKPSR